MSYTCALKDGTVIHSGTSSHYSPTQAVKVMPGFAEVLQLMAEGDHWRVFLPYDHAYGEQGSTSPMISHSAKSDIVVPPYSPIVLDVKLLKVKSTRGKPAENARKKFQHALFDNMNGEL